MKPLDPTQVRLLVRLTEDIGRQTVEMEPDLEVEDLALVLHDGFLPQVTQVCGVEVIHSPYVPERTVGYLFNRALALPDLSAEFIEHLVRGASPL